MLIVLIVLIVVIMDAQFAKDEMLEEWLPAECGDAGVHVIELLQALRELARFHNALSHFNIHCYFIKVGVGVS